MTFDDLRESWQVSNQQAVSPQMREELVGRTCRRVERLGSRILRRDWIETIAGVLVSLVFCWSILEIDGVVANPLAKFGAAMTILSGWYMVYRLHQTRTGQRRSALDAPIREFFGTEIKRLERQIHLGRSVLSWYVLPMSISVCLWAFGMVGINATSLGLVAFSVLVGWSIYLKHQREVNNLMLPLHDELQELFRELNETE